MGQRQATYVIVESGRTKLIMPIYNQWNYIKIQSSKLVRGIKAVSKFNWGYNSPESILPIYFANAGDNTYKDESGKFKSEWVGGRDETNEYSHKANCYTSAYQEDNNNGWNIIKFTFDSAGNVKTQLFCIVGSEDERKTTNVSIEQYFYEYKDIEDVKYLIDNCTWNPMLEREAENLLSDLHYSSLSPARVKKLKTAS